MSLLGPDLITSPYLLGECAQHADFGGILMSFLYDQMVIDTTCAGPVKYALYALIAFHI